MNVNQTHRCWKTGLLLVSIAPAIGCGGEKYTADLRPAVQGPVTLLDEVADTANDAASLPERVTLVAQAPQAAPAASFAFPADGTGALLAGALTPPKQLPLEPVAVQGAPRDWQTAPAQNALSRQLFPLAVADAPLATRLLAQDKGGARRLHRALDAPPMHLAAQPPLPARTWLPYGNLSFAARPQGEAVPPLTVHPRPWEAALTATTNPVAREAFVQVVKSVPPVAATPAPRLDLDIPDPFSLPRQARLLNPPADTDPPAGSSSALPRPKLPIEPAG